MEASSDEVEVEAVVVVDLARVDVAGSAVVAALPGTDEADADWVAHLADFLLLDLPSLLQQGADRFWRVELVDEGF